MVTIARLSPSPTLPLKTAPPSDWTVLVYTSSTADIEKATAAGLQELSQQMGKTVQVAVQWGKAGQAERLEARSGALESAQKLDATDMSKPDTLADFLIWGMKRYPARHYAVVVGGHGAGFLGCVTNSEKRRMMRLPELRQALEAAPYKPDMVALNTCLMSCSETAAELQSVTPALVASQAAEEGLGMPLGSWIAGLDQCPDGLSAARALVAQCKKTPERTRHVSGIDLAQVKPYLKSVERLGGEILASPQSRPQLQEDLKAVTGLWEHSWDSVLYRQVDVGALCQRWGEDERLPQPLRQAADAACGSAARAVLQKTGDPAQPGEVGLSLFAPDKPWEGMALFDKTLGEIYADLGLSKATGWDQVIHALTPVRA